MVPATEAEVTGMSIHCTMPASVSKVVAPRFKLAMVVAPEERS